MLVVLEKQSSRSQPWNRIGSVAGRSYHQYCGLARALELVGERWALLVVRDLILGPKRFTDLRQGLPRIPSNILAARLKELEEVGIVRRRVLPRPATAVVYELTAYGLELEEIVLRFGRWGAKSLGDPHPEDMLTLDSLSLALMATFQPAAATGIRVSYELNVGPVTIHAQVADGKLDVGRGPLPEADLVIHAGPLFKRLIARELTPGEALASGTVRVEGDPALFDRFIELFRILPIPVAS
jgi:DNA-binding HxlR family transcriptional regulator